MRGESTNKGSENIKERMVSDKKRKAPATQCHCSQAFTFSDASSTAEIWRRDVSCGLPHAVQRVSLHRQESIGPASYTIISTLEELMGPFREATALLTKKETRLNMGPASTGSAKVYRDNFTVTKLML